MQCNIDFFFFTAVFTLDWTQTQARYKLGGEICLACLLSPIVKVPVIQHQVLSSMMCGWEEGMGDPRLHGVRISWWPSCSHTAHQGTSHEALNTTPSALSDGFPESSAGKESACNAGDPGLIPRSGRSPGERKGYPLQYSGLENPCIVHGVTRVGHDWVTLTFSPL